MPVDDFPEGIARFFDPFQAFVDVVEVGNIRRIAEEGEQPRHGERCGLGAVAQQIHAEIAQLLVDMSGHGGEIAFCLFQRFGRGRFVEGLRYSRRLVGRGERGVVYDGVKGVVLERRFR